MVLQDVQADAPSGIDITVVDSGGKVDLWGLKRIIRREMDVKKVDAPRIGTVVGSHNSSLPVKDVVSDGSGTTVGWRVVRQVL